MTQTDLFRRLGAPLANSRWSWGGVRGTDMAVFLRVWQDRMMKFEGRLYMMVTHHEKFADDPQNLGYQERVLHVNMIQGGAPCYMVMCLAKDVSAAPRTIKSFNSKEIFVGGKVMEKDGNIWVEVVNRKPIAEVCDRARQ